MSAGIESYGAYIPIYRMSLEVLAQVWGGSARRGEKAIANWDEDSLTMAVEAGIDCLKGIERESVDGLYLASTSLPYREKQAASIVAKALDLRRDVVTADMTDSARGGTLALRAALDAVNAGSAKRFLVIASDCRVPHAHSSFEERFGDGAAALLVGASDPIVEIEDRHTISSEFMDIWRREEDRHVQSWEDRFIIQHGYAESMHKAISGLMEKQDLSPEGVDRAVLYAPAARAQQALARRLGLDPDTQLQDLLIGNVGISGCAHALLMLAAALDEVEPGDRILLASYGNGADAFLLGVGEEIDRLRGGRRGVKGFLNSKKALPSYVRYLSYRGLLEPEPGETLRLFPSATASWRERNWAIRMHGSKCRDCGTIHFPVERVCFNCSSKDNYEEVRLSDKKAEVFTYTLDNLAGRVDDPMIPQITLEFEIGRARAYLLMTDCRAEDVSIGMPVEMTFRRMYESRGMYQYFWKCRPIR